RYDVGHVEMRPVQEAPVFRRLRRCAGHPRRRGASTVDYVLLLGLLLPIAVFALPAGRRILEAVFRMTCTLIGWPFP
ncbi:MAG: hypothetical protein D6725_09090, partial [Planctomycetota bacterium]